MGSRQEIRQIINQVRAQARGDLASAAPVTENTSRYAYQDRQSQGIVDLGRGRRCTSGDLAGIIASRR